MDEILVASWAELHEQLFADSWNEELGLHRSDFAFRGRADAADDLGTSLVRLGGRRPSKASTTGSRHPDLVRRLVIPGNLKWEVRDKLDQANLTERVLFPGLDGLSRWVARYYAPRRS
jgi:hypothetical protein